MDIHDQPLRFTQPGSRLVRLLFRVMSQGLFTLHPPLSFLLSCLDYGEHLSAKRSGGKPAQTEIIKYIWAVAKIRL